ncbi:MAG TPA: type II toxin-antitoxin system VapC family toxin [Candidatus Nanoarchaeia archaeon]|nr:type II toxin-antitoxin system VapC family toxin [Candidatus Nanoarchaeia archaeon]
MVDTYALDTTFLIDLLRNNPAAKELAIKISKEHICTTQVNVYELLFGFYSSKPENLDKLIERSHILLDRLTILPLTNPAIEQSAKIGGSLNRKGWRIDHTDCLIAGTLLANDCTTLVTRNTEHFKRIPGLKVKTY